MNDKRLKTKILSDLAHCEFGLHADTLKASVSLEFPDLSTDDYADALKALKDAGAVNEETTIMGDRLYTATARGLAALKGV